MQDFLVTPGVARQLLGVSTPTLFRYAQQGKLKFQKTPGGQHRYFVSALAEAAHCPGDIKFFEYARQLLEGYKCRV